HETPTSQLAIIAHDNPRADRKWYLTERDLSSDRALMQREGRRKVGTQRADMRFPRVIRFDDSDLRVYATPSRPGEWAVSGAFAFLGLDLERADGKTREAFRHGFLGLDSF